MVSWGSEVEDSSPRLGEGRAEERGARGVTVSSSILRSCCDGTVGRDMSNKDYQFTNMLLFYLYLTGALIQKHNTNSHTSSWYFLSSSATSLCAFSHSSLSFSCSRRYFSCYHGNRHMKYSTEPQRRLKTKVDILAGKRRWCADISGIERVLRGFSNQVDDAALS